MNRPTLPASPLSTWTPFERERHAVIKASLAIAADVTCSPDMRKAAKGTAKTNVEMLNGSLAARGARTGYTV